MRRLITVSRLSLALAGAALTLAVAAPAAGQEVEATNVTPYAPSFFAEYRPNTARDMIGRLPGFSFEGGSSARGFAGTAGNVLIDGERPPSRGDSLSDVLARIPASAVARIDLIRGGAPGIDMQGQPIIANIIRKPGGGLTGSVSGSLDFNDRSDLTRGSSIQGQRQADGRLVEGSLNYNRHENTGLEHRVRNLASGTLDESGRQRSSFDFEQFEGTAATEMAMFGGRMRLNGQASLQHTASTSREVLIVPGGENLGRGLGDRHAAEVGLRYTRNLFKGFDMEAVAFHSLYDSMNRGETIRPAFSSGTVTESEGGESIGAIAVHSPAYGAWKFDLGAEAAFNFVESTSIRSIDGAPLSLSGDSSRVEELRTDSHAVATWTPSPTLNVEAGLRYERSTITAGPIEKSLSFLKPRVNVSWTPKPGHQFGFRVERLVDQLSFGAFQSSVSFNSSLGNTVFAVGNNDLEPEHRWVIDARYERRFGREGYFIAEISHRLMDDVLGRIVIPAPTATSPTRTVEITANVGEAIRTTYSASTAIPLDAWGLEGAVFKAKVNIRESETLDPVVDGFSRRVNGDEPFGWEASLSRNVQRLNLSWSIHANGGDEAVNYSPRSIFDYDNDFALGANFSWRPRPDLTVGGGVNNINRGDDFNQLVFYTAPRSIGVPLYIEESLRPGVRSVFLSLRKSFL